MTNAELIMNAITSEIENGNLDEEILELEIDTFAGWKRKGFTVKKGEKASFTTSIWKPKKYDVKDKNKDEIVVDENGKPIQTTRLIMVKASFFTENQVERKEVR